MLSRDFLFLIVLLVSLQFGCVFVSSQQLTTLATRNQYIIAGYNTGYYSNAFQRGMIPTGILCGPDDYIYSLDRSGSGLSVFKIDPHGVVASYFGSYDTTLSTNNLHGFAFYNDTVSGTTFLYRMDPDKMTISKYMVSKTANGGQDMVPILTTRMTLPVGLAVLNNGDLLISDARDNVIRRVNMSAPGLDGNYTTSIIAGKLGDSGYGGEYALATNTSLASPMGITVYGNAFYFAEVESNIIRKVDLQTMELSTVAGMPNIAGDYVIGGMALTSALKAPQSVAFTSSGEMVISDTGNNKIKKVFLNGTIITIAGNGTSGFSGDGGNAMNALLNYPTSISVANNGDIYFTDSNNFRIRKIVSGTNVISTVAGNGLKRNYGEDVQANGALFNQATGFAFSPTYPNHVIYVADSANNRIRSFSQFYSQQNMKTVAGQATSGLGGEGLTALSSSFNFPTNLVFHPVTGDLIIVDTNNNRIRKMNKNSIVQTFAGTGVRGFNGNGLLSNSTLLNFPTGLGVLSTGEIIFSDTGSNYVRMIDLQGFITALNVNVSSPKGIAITNNNEIVIADQGNQRVLRCTKNSVCTVIAGTTGVKGSYPTSFNIAVPGTSVTFTDPSYVATNLAGDIFVMDSGNGRIVKIARDGKAANALQNIVNGAGIGFSEYTQSIIYFNSGAIHQLTASCPANYILSIYDYECNLITCSGFPLTNSSVCSSRGNCTAMDTCVCKTDDSYFGKNCEFKLCNGVQIPSSQTCTTTQPPSSQETKVETIQITSLNSKNVAFEKFKTIQVTFPSSFISQLNSSGSVSGNTNVDLVSSVANQTLDASLNSLSDNNTVLLVSSIISISIYNRDTGKEIPVSQLTDPINIQMSSISIPSTLLQEKEFAFVCMYLDTATNTWKSDGVETIIQNKQTISDTLTFSTICKTSHLTSFAVIDPNYKKATQKSDSSILDTNTIIGIAVGGGAGLIIVCTMLVLLIVLIVVCCSKKRK